jgi:hypothetical protein
MTTIKSYTDLEQSKRLSNILALESADMYYTPSLIKGHTNYFPHLKRKFTIDWDIEQAIPCWSLAALLSVLPPYLYEWEKGIDFNLYPSVAKKRWWCAGYISQDLSPKNKDKFTLITHADNPVDACYKMILKLNELKML